MWKMWNMEVRTVPQCGLKLACVLAATIIVASCVDSTGEVEIAESPTEAGSAWWEELDDELVSCGVQTSYVLYSASEVAEGLAEGIEVGADSPEELVQRYAEQRNPLDGTRSTPSPQDPTSLSVAFQALAHAMGEGRVESTKSEFPTPDEPITMATYEYGGQGPFIRMYEAESRWFPFESEVPVPCTPFDFDLLDPRRERVARIKVDPSDVRPGESVDLHFPDRAERAELFRLERREDDPYGRGRDHVAPPLV
jgi:hypothetical protein